MLQELGHEDQVRTDAYLASFVRNDRAMARAIRAVVFDDAGVRAAAVEHGVPRSSLDRKSREFRRLYGEHLTDIGRCPPRTMAS